MSTTDAAAEARPDENTLVMPEAWLRRLHPRRDRPHDWPRVRVDGKAAARARELMDGVRAGVEEVLALPGTPPEVATAARAYLGGEADPVGAAAVALVTAPLHGQHGRGRPNPYVDAWAEEHGVPFAACAYIALAGLWADFTVPGSAIKWNGVRERKPSEDYCWWLHEDTAKRLRALLAAADDRAYAEAVERMARRRGSVLQKIVASYLAPERAEWFAELCADPVGTLRAVGHGDRWMLLCSFGERDHVDLFGLSLDYSSRGPGVIASLVDGVGPDAVLDLLTDSLDTPYLDSDGARSLLDALAALPLDAAFQALLDRLDRKYVGPAVLAAARRFPARALRLLAAAADRPAAADLLSAHVRAEPAVAAGLLPALPETARAAVRAALDAGARVPEADPASLPPLLVDPPWNRPRAKTKPVVIKDLPAPGTRAMAWRPGEREEWTVDLHHYWRWVDRLDWPTQVAKFRKGELLDHMQPMLFVEGPEELVRPLLAGWTPPEPWYVDEWMRVVVARFELDALDAAVLAARRDPAGVGAILMPYLSDEVARLMADWLVRLKQAGRTARAWFTRHGLGAVPALLPAALGKAGAERRAAEAALRFVASQHGAASVVDAARVHGDKAAAAIEALLAVDPLEILPAKIPAVGDWADVRMLPQILLRDRERALPDAAAAHVLTMLAMSKPGEVYAGIDTVRDLCDRESLAEFGWALFRRWEANGGPSKDGWALAQLGRLGDDGTVRRLTPVIRAWPGDGGHAKAVTGLDVLAEIGTDVALMHLHSIAQKVKFKGLRTRAQEKIEEVAAGLELTPEQLADRLVPDFGLGPDGSMTLDYGPRRFTVGFDEQLRPYVADEGGERRKALPKPGAKDDPELAPAAYKAFSALKKDVRMVAADLLARLETAMVRGRRWSLTEFRGLLAGHPLVRHLVRRLVWIAVEMDQYKSITFRVAEDGTFASAHDSALELPETVVVGVAHPVHMQQGDRVAAWAEVFADYEILQPFPQLGRPVYELTDEERKSGHLTRFEGATVPVGRMLGLTKRGWERGAPQDAGVECWISRPAGVDLHVVIDLDPGIAVGNPDALPDQRLRQVCLCRRRDELWMHHGDPLPFGRLDPVTASEVIADLTALTADAG
ncbi:DUF4132 domain-containing protein [Actinomadura verrucosospora]|uniref:WGR domain-containing protein n=1 Tax=Actinomadura verrucosospora TaxID=46165 RepID=A0A7D3VQI3_ACTVE|nr:DUF4132 domain-containing protein [Actinomadura verrucosospora]QKG20398.1 WGR domain-containing protein [Actinomadura verrucosospora]